MFTQLPPFSNSSTAFFTSLGKTAKVSGPALVALQPLLARVKTLGSAAKPFSGSLAELFTSLRDTGGLERLMDFIFLGAGTTNGYDALGHFLRAEVVANLCLTYAIDPVAGVQRQTLQHAGHGAPTREQAQQARRRAPSTTSLVMERTLAVLKGATPAQAIAKYPGSTSSAEALAGAGAAGRKRSERPAGRRLERRHHLLHALGRRLRSQRDAAQLPARQLSDAR